MNTQVRFALAIVASFVVGALFVGSAFAVPRVLSATRSDVRSGYSMMSGYERPISYSDFSAEEMNRFMDSYRDSAGAIDFDRMHRDVTSGEVDSPCGSGGAAGQRTPGWQDDGRDGYGMMGWS